MLMNNVKIVKVRDSKGNIKIFTINGNGQVVDQATGANVPLNFANQKEACKWAKKAGAQYDGVTLGL